MPVRGRIYDRLGPDVAACPRPILRDEGLTEPVGKPLTDQSRGDVHPAARGKRNDDAHRSRRIDLRAGDARDRRQRGSARGQI